jgi:PAS domain-containing protein
MLSASTAQVLFANGNLSITLAGVNGEVQYENPLAREQFNRGEQAQSCSLQDLFASPYRWQEIVGNIANGQSLTDEPVVIQSEQGNTEICYLTALPQFKPTGELDSILCIWSFRKDTISKAIREGSGGTCENYTRDLESLLEHRTFRQLLISEQNQRAQDALNILPVGILITSNTGDIVYANFAMSDLFGLRSGNYLKPNVRYVLRPDLVETFDRVVESGRRIWHEAVDPAQNPASVDFLPLLTQGTVDKVVLQFSRLYSPVSEQTSAATI